MKKLFLIPFALLILCTCTPKTQSTPLNKSNCWDYPDRQLHYRGHVYYIWDRYSYGIAVVHNPDCPCYKKEQKSANKQH